MTDISKYNEQIQKYLAGEFSSAELVDFENLVKANSKLQDEIRLYQKVNSAISDSSLENFKHELDAIHRQNFSSSISFKSRWYIAAAIIVLLITVGYLLLHQSGVNDSQNVFNKYYYPIDADGIRSEGVVMDNYAYAVSLYNEEQYALAFPEFKNSITEFKENYAGRLYLGICAIEIGEYEIAEEQFKIIIDSKDVFYVQDAEWYLALMFLKLKETDISISYLKAIEKKGFVYAQKASLVLGQLQ